MTPELEARLAQIAQEERYEPGSEPLHALRRGAELALQCRPTPEFRGLFQPDIYGNMIKCDCGGYVCSDDYEALSLEVEYNRAMAEEAANLLTRNKELMAERDLYRGEASLHKRKLESAEAAAYANGRTIALEEVDRLRAENAELKQQCDSLLIGLAAFSGADVSIDIAGEKITAKVASIKAEAIRDAAEHVERTHRHIPSTRFNHGALDALQRVKEYARQIEGQGNG